MDINSLLAGKQISPPRLETARSDPFGLGMKAFGDGVARSNCPFPSNYFEGRHWLLGWDYGRSRSAARRFGLGVERAQ